MKDIKHLKTSYEIMSFSPRHVLQCSSGTAFFLLKYSDILCNAITKEAVDNWKLLKSRLEMNKVLQKWQCGSNAYYYPLILYGTLRHRTITAKFDNKECSNCCVCVLTLMATFFTSIEVKMDYVICGQLNGYFTFISELIILY